MAPADIQTTPIAFHRYAVRHAKAGSIGSEFQSLPQYRAASAEDMAHKAIRMEVAEFADYFFRIPSQANLEARPHWDSGTFNALLEGHNLLEAEISEHFIRIVNELNLAPGLKLASSPDKPDMEDMDESRQKPDAAFFKSHMVPSDGRPSWADQIVSVEFKRHETDMDPFDDRDEENVDASALERKKVRGQLIGYAEHIFRVQQRVALFMLLVIGRNFRVIRWDRSGAIVTRAVDYVAQPHILCKLLWQLSLQTEEGLGMDPSTTRLFVHDEDHKLMDAFAEEVDTDLATEEGVVTTVDLQADPLIFKYVRLAFRCSLTPNWPHYRVHVPSDGGQRSFLIGKPLFHARGMSGRGTRGYVALDCKTKRFVWLKDAWRVHYESVDQEGATLEQLNQKSVPYVPTLVCHGDILEQVTETPHYWELKNPSRPILTPIPPFSGLSSSQTLTTPRTPSSKGRKRRISEVQEHEEQLRSFTTVAFREDCPLRKHTHYRIVVNEVAMPLSEFQYGRQLISIVMDCVRAHWKATADAQIIHRDISGGNILIYPKVIFMPKSKKYKIKWTGLLTDWELSKPTYEKEPFVWPRQPPRTGTWQYLSVALLSSDKPIEIPDELESFMHVILYHSVRYLKSNCNDVASYIERFFDAHTVDDNVYTCGLAKLAAVKLYGRLEIKDKLPLKFDSPLDDLFKRLLSSFHAHYVVQDFLERQAQAAKTTLRSTSPSPSKPVSNWAPPVEDDDEDEDDELAKSSDTPEPEVPDDKPTPDMERRAACVSSHQGMFGALKTAFKALKWRIDDKEGDRVSPAHNPLFPVGPPQKAAPATCKRRKTVSMIEFHSCHPAAIPRLHHSL
ncbi:hypothetical protein C8Q79DRAFT_1014110 [Trametes meyenii]|nr:hypothetical protein C8Q79DRAFT_1014110 [Trametes meyenii]